MMSLALLKEEKHVESQYLSSQDSHHLFIKDSLPQQNLALVKKTDAICRACDLKNHQACLYNNKITKFDIYTCHCKHCKSFRVSSVFSVHLSLIPSISHTALENEKERPEIGPAQKSNMSDVLRENGRKMRFFPGSIRLASLLCDKNVIRFSKLMLFRVDEARELRVIMLPYFMFFIDKRQCPTESHVT